MNIHKFYLNNMYVVLDVNSGAVHIVDKMIYDILDFFDGNNDDEVLQKLADQYDKVELVEAITELKVLMQNDQLFSEPIEVPASFTAEPPYVKSLCLHIAHDCNLRCHYCFGSTGSFGHERGFMTQEVGEKAIDFVIEHSGPRKNCEVDFFGGEPLMNFAVVKHIVGYIKKREQETGKIFKMTMTTNATLLTEEVIQFLTENKISLVISVDGRKQVHDAMRPYVYGKGSYADVMKNAKKAFAMRPENDFNYGMYTIIRGTYTAKNLDFASDVLDLADKGFKELSIEPVVAKDADYALTVEHLPVLFGQYEKLAKEYLKRIQEGNGFDFFHFNLALDNGPCVSKRLRGCGAGHEYFAVAPTGELYPCHQFVGRDEYLIGTVFEGIKKPELMQKFKEAHVLNKPACKECWARFYCSGGCHANADLFHGTIDQPYELGCELQKKRLECAIMIQAKLLQDKQEN